MNEDIIKFLLNLYRNPFFKKGFTEFFVKMQEEGIESARKFWNIYPDKDKLFENAPEMFEQMIDFYSDLGFVPRKMYNDVVKENEELKKENKFLKDTIKELNLKVFTEGSIKIQEAWKTTIEKQMEMSKEIAENFFYLLKKVSK